MIESVQMFTATCDRCGEEYSADGDSVTVFHEVAGLIECIKMEDEPWYLPVSLLLEGSGPIQKCYCPGCIDTDENGIITIKPALVGPVDMRGMRDSGYPVSPESL